MKALYSWNFDRRLEKSHPDSVCTLKDVCRLANGSASALPGGKDDESITEINTAFPGGFTFYVMSL